MQSLNYSKNSEIHTTRIVGAVRMLKATQDSKNSATQKKWTELSNNRNSQIALFTVQIQKLNWRQRSTASHTKLLSTVNINSVMSVCVFLSHNICLPRMCIYGAHVYTLYTTAASRRIRCHQHITMHIHTMPTYKKNKNESKWNIRTKY